MNLRCCQNKYHILRRFLQRLQKCIKCSDRQHMHLINNVNLEAAFRWTIRHFLTDLSNIIHTIVRCRINLNHIHRCTGCNRLAHRTLSAWTSIHRMFTIHRLGKYLCHSRLSCSTSSAK